MPTIAEKKARLRQEYKAAERQRAKDPEVVKSMSHRACAGIIYSQMFMTARAIMLYATLPGEPDPTKIAEHALSLGKTVAFPRIDWASRELTPAVVGCVDDGAANGLVLQRLGLREPNPACPPLDPAKLDLIIVPALAFDAAGNRLGRGGGFYDRFLAGLAGGPGCKRPVTCGLCFSTSLVAVPPGLPVEAHDHRVDAVATELGLSMVGG
ncbi:MAG: 5-formyltetrahydrofolate cyclo-ligase [Phycisphaerales bacterium]|nr:5-formyltetrahydrofolate cyclo-ligase [Phycisphaerales bacterium]